MEHHEERSGAPGQDDRPALVRRWEELPVRLQFFGAYAAGFLAIFGLHLALFTRITAWRALGYALFEAILLAGLVVLATQSELARRRGANDHER